MIRTSYTPVGCSSSEIEYQRPKAVDPIAELELMSKTQLIDRAESLELTIPPRATILIIKELIITKLEELKEEEEETSTPEETTTEEETSSEGDSTTSEGESTIPDEKPSG